MDVQMKTAVFKPLDPISVLSVLEKFKEACDSNSTHWYAAMCFFLYSIWDSVKAALSRRVTSDNKKNHQQEGKFVTY